MFFIKKKHLQYTDLAQNYRICLFVKLFFSLDSEGTNEIILPAPDNSVCFVLFQYKATSVIPVIYVMLPNRF